jgi:hypothetical protein
VVLFVYIDNQNYWSLEQSEVVNEGEYIAVGITTGYELDSRGFRIQVPVEARFFSFPRRPDRYWGPPSPYPMGNGASFSGGKAAGAA